MLNFAISRNTKGLVVSEVSYDDDGHLRGRGSEMKYICSVSARRLIVAVVPCHHRVFSHPWNRDVDNKGRREDA